MSGGGHADCLGGCQLALPSGRLCTGHPLWCTVPPAQGGADYESSCLRTPVVHALTCADTASGAASKTRLAAYLSSSLLEPSDGTCRLSGMSVPCLKVTCREQSQRRRHGSSSRTTKILGPDLVDGEG